MKKCFALFFCLSPLTLLALPQGMEVQSGHASPVRQENHLHLDNSDRAILRWNDFSIGKGESVHFTSSSLNRVTGKNCSHLLGKLTSDGTIFLINPNGVFIGGSASIQTGGFLASTADVSNDDFINGKELHFHTPGPGEILNQGQINCPQGDIFLISKTVRNEGKLTGKHVHMLSEQEVLIRPNDNEKVLIRAAFDEGQIENTGVIEALTVDLQTTSPYEKAICQNGHINATSSRRENGRIYLVAENGGTEVGGAMISQEVQVLGQEVTLQEHTYIDASGPEGGTVLIGGDYQGSNPEILNAQATTAKKGSVVKVDSTSNGDGGKIIYWSDGITTFAGNASARGGPEGGDGGFVEVSGKKQFIYAGQSDRRAPKGQPGKLLLDPDADVTISSVGDTNITTTGSPVTIEPTAAAANVSTLLGQILLTELASGDVTISTEFAGGGGSGDVTFVAGSPFAWSTNSLTIDAGRDVNFNADVINSGTGNFIVNANRSINVASNFTVESTSSGDIHLNANMNGNTSGNFIGLTLNSNAQVLVDSGTLSVRAHGGDTGNFNRGVLINSNARIGSLSSGTVTIHGTGGSGASFNDGIFGNGGDIIGGTGNVTIQGTGQGNGTNNRGVRYQGGMISSQSGNLSITGIATTTIGDANQGVRIVGATIQTTSGDIEIVAQGTSPNGGQGFAMTNSGSVNTGDGQISITGSSLFEGSGVLLEDPGTAIFTTGTGSVILDGTGVTSPSLDSGFGISVRDNALVSTQSGDLDLIGEAVFGNIGVNTRTSGRVETASGTLTIQGTGGSNGGNGVTMQSGGRVESTSGQISIQGTGGSEANDQVGVSVSGAGTGIVSVSAPISITGNGAGTDSDNYGIFVSSDGIISSGNGSITLNGTGSTIATGTNNSGVRVSGTVSRVETFSGNIQVSGSGGTGGGSNLGIHIDGSGEFISTSGSVTLNGAGGTGGGGNYGIAIENTGSQVTSSSGELFLTGSSGASTQEGILINSNGVVTSAGSRPITLRTFSDIVVQTNGSITAQGSGNLLLDASENIHLETSSLVSTNTGNLTLVVDSRFPAPPNIGSGAFIIDAGATLTSGGELRLYTARQSQNSISELINGLAFFPGAFNVNTLAETWSTYFPGGLYGGLSFNFYYKDPILPPITRNVYQNIAANLVQLPALLPNIMPQRVPFVFPNYHFQVCEEEICAPTFSPYGSFIFEDDLWWIGETP